VYREGSGPDRLQAFCGASLGKLASFTICPGSNSINNFLEAFETVVLTTSIPASLSAFKLHTTYPWRPNYRSLLPFTQMQDLILEFSCEPSCSSTIDDDTIIDLAQAMPNLQDLRLGHRPCATPTGVSVKGLAALAHYCSHLLNLVIHFQVDSLDPADFRGIAYIPGSTVLPGSCTLLALNAGSIPLPEDSELMVALTLLHIFPNLEDIGYSDDVIEWDGVSTAIANSKRLASGSSKICLFAVP
jgi:hypothetical protein